MSDLLFVFLAIICYIILGSLYNYLVIKYDEIPYFKNKLKKLDIEYKKNNGKIMKYLDNIQLENDIYEYNTDPKCDIPDKYRACYAYRHIPDRENCKCGYSISNEKYTKLVKKINKIIKSY